MRILGVDCGFDRGIVNCVGVEDVGSERKVVIWKSDYDMDCCEMVTYIDNIVTMYNIDKVVINPTGIGMSIINKIERGSELDKKLLDPGIMSLKKEHIAICKLQKHDLPKQMGLEMLVKLQGGYCRINSSPMESSVLHALMLANYGFELKEELEFNEENVRRIADKCITSELWEVPKGELYDYYKERRDINRKEFVSGLVYCITHNKVMHLTDDKWHRGIGKTHFINEISKTFKIPVIYRLKTSKRLHENKVFKSYLLSEIEEVNPCTVLVDDLISIQDINKLRKLGFEVIGFTRSFGRYNFL